MLRHFATVSLGTLVSRATGFLRDALIAALLGAGAVADIFLVPFQLVSAIRRLIGEGALNAALVPAWLRLREAEGDEAAAQFAGRALSVLTLALCALAFAIACAAPLLIAAPGSVAKSIAIWLMLPYLAFAAPVAVAMAVLNAQARFALTSFTPVLFNLLLIATAAALLVAGAHSVRSSYALAGAIGLAGLVQLAVLRQNGGARIAAAKAALDAPMRDFLSRALPGMIASASPQLLTLAGIGFAASIPGAVSWLYFATRLVELPLGLVGVAMGTVMVPLIARDRENAVEAERHAAELALALTVPACVALFVLALPITRVLFEHGAFTAADTGRTALALAMLSLGLPVQALIKLLSAGFFGRGNTRTPMIATLAGLAATVALAALLMPRGHVGIAFAIVCGTCVQGSWLIVARRREVPLPIGPQAAMRFLKLVFAAMAMGWVLHVAERLLGTPASPWLAALALAALVALGLAVYALALRYLGVVTFDQLRAALKRE